MCSPIRGEKTGSQGKVLDRGADGRRGIGVANGALERSPAWLANASGHEIFFWASAQRQPVACDRMLRGDFIVSRPRS